MLILRFCNAEWYRTDRGFICRYCYDKKRTYVEINAVAREKMVKNHNRGVTSALFELLWRNIVWRKRMSLYNKAIRFAINNHATVKEESP